jgi:nickel/cobalt transporter (NicO) family protein
MLELLSAVTLLSLLHALIPSHWAPIIALSKSEGWSLRETITVTLLAGLAHVFSTVLIGVLLGMMGLQLSQRFQQIAHLVTPIVLIVMGFVYAGLGHVHSLKLGPSDVKPTRSRATLIGGLATAMFFAPCLEIEPLYISAGVHGVLGLVLVSLIYALLTLTGMVLVVRIGTRGASRLRLGWLEHHERKLTGGLLVGLGILSFFIRF